GASDTPLFPYTTLFRSRPDGGGPHTDWPSGASARATSLAPLIRRNPIQTAPTHRRKPSELRAFAHGLLISWPRIPPDQRRETRRDRKSTRLNSSHRTIS